MLYFTVFIITKFTIIPVFPKNSGFVVRMFLGLNDEIQFLYFHR